MSQSLHRDSLCADTIIKEIEDTTNLRNTPSNSEIQELVVLLGYYRLS